MTIRTLGKTGKQLSVKWRARFLSSRLWTLGPTTLRRLAVLPSEVMSLYLILQQAFQTCPSARLALLIPSAR